MEERKRRETIPSSRLLKPMFSTRYFILFSTAFLYFLPTCARAARVLAPYLLVSSEKELAFDIASCIAATGLEAITLSHITADAGGNPAWLGVTPIDSEYAVNLVEQAHSSGMQVIVSFEGTSGGMRGESRIYLTLLNLDYFTKILILCFDTLLIRIRFS